MSRHTPPAGDIDLSGARAGAGENIRDGGVGPSGSGFSSTRRLGGMRSTSDGAGSYGVPPEAEDDDEGARTGGAQTTLGDVVSAYGVADADGSALDPPEDEDDEDDDDEEEELSVEEPLASGARTSIESSSRSSGDATDVEGAAADGGAYETETVAASPGRTDVEGVGGYDPASTSVNAAPSRVGEGDDAGVGSTDAMEGSTGGLAGSSR